MNTNNNMDMAAELAKLRAENALLKSKAIAKRTITFKVSEKGAVSIYGLGRFPVTLYKSQFEALEANFGKLKQFVSENSSRLVDKTSLV